MTHQAHRSARVNKRQVVFLGMGVAKSDSEEQPGKEVVNNLDLAFLPPQPPPPRREITPRSGQGVNSTHRRA